MVRNIFGRTFILTAVKLLFLIYSAYAQGKNKQYNDFKVTVPEKCWAFFHPFAACKIYKAALRAREEVEKISNNLYLDNRNNGGMLDAFRHSYWMALCSQRVRLKKALRFGYVHEKGNYRMFLKQQFEEEELPDSISSAMDLYNNSIGAFAGNEFRKLSEDSLKHIIISKVKAGNMKIIAMDCNNNYVDCNNQPVDMKKYRHQWQNTKCLVNSNKKCADKK